MANRYFNQFMWSLEKNPVKLYARCTFGSSGAVTLDATNSKGIKSISLGTTGKYTVTFGVGSNTDIYNRIFFVAHRFLNATAPAAPTMYVVSQAVSTAGTVVLQFTAADGSTATNPGSGEELWLEFTLKNSTAP